MVLLAKVKTVNSGCQQERETENTTNANAGQKTVTWVRLNSRWICAAVSPEDYEFIILARHWITCGDNLDARAVYFIIVFAASLLFLGHN
jgi:hypothetical protein